MKQKILKRDAKSGVVDVRISRPVIYKFFTFNLGRKKVVPRHRIELRTYGLQNHCSTTELAWHFEKRFLYTSY